VTGRDQSSLDQRRPRRAARPELLRGLVVAIAGAGALAGAVTVLVADQPVEPTPIWMPLALAILMVVASAAAVRVRLRSTNAVMTWTDAAITVCIVCLPPGWVPVCVGTGVALAKLVRRVAPVKVAYNAGKDILAATAGLLVAVPLGVADVTDPLARPGQVVLVAVTVTITQHLIGTPVLALASSTRWTRILRADADITVASLVGKTLHDDAAIAAAADAAYAHAKPMDNTDFVLHWRKRVVREFVTYALRELRGEDMRETRRKYGRQDLVWVS